MIRIVYNYYTPNNEERKNEIDYCLNKIKDNIHIDEIILILNESDNNKFKIKSNKFKKIINNSLPTYEWVFNLIDEITSTEDINIVINSDCYFDENTMGHVNKITHNESWCLARWDIVDEKFNNKLRDVDCSQDCWVIRGKPKKMKNINFGFGIVGCDNRICFEMNACGYNVKNPSKSFKIYHYHLTNIRTYGNGHSREKNRINGGYKFIKPHKI